jgi:hypothetical protein
MSINPVLKQKAIDLRQAGNSYGYIAKSLGLKSKGTLSAWFKDLELSPGAKQALQQNIARANKRGFLQFNKERSARISVENEAALEQGRKQIGKLSKRELMLVGAALYWGEGTKYQRTNGSLTLVFTNSDPLMVRVFMRFVREILKIEELRIRAGIHLYDPLKTPASRLYWSKVTGLPIERFYISQQRSRASKGVRNSARLPHGTVCIRVNSRTIFNRVLGMIDGLSRA